MRVCVNVPERAACRNTVVTPAGGCRVRASAPPGGRARRSSCCSTRSTPVDETVDVRDHPAAEPRVHLEQARAAARVLRLGVEHAVPEAECERRADAEVGQRREPLGRMRRRASACRSRRSTAPRSASSRRRPEKTHAPPESTMSTSNSVPSRYSSSRRSEPCSKIAFSSGVISAATRVYPASRICEVVGPQAAERLGPEDGLDHGREADLGSGGLQALGRRRGA